MIRELMKIKREQLRLEKLSKLLLQRIAFELKEIKSFLELSLTNKR